MSNKPSARTTSAGAVNELKAAQEAHESICAVRYENIEKRLDDGSKRFTRVEQMVFGVYALIIATQVIAEVF
tara:strand:- start:407 stop:622 length:216 start_codon:yes stop_codon:yes gene_type:complete